MTDVQQELPGDAQPRQVTTRTKVNSGQGESSVPRKIGHKVHPIASLFKRSLRAGSIHPSPSSGANVASAQRVEPSLEKKQQQDTTPEIKNDAILKKEAISTFMLALAPAAMTFYRAYYGNSGPTWFSFHPLMMTVSTFSMLGAMVCQILGGPNNITLVGSLSFASAFSMLIGLYVIWSTKEMYAKTHFMTMHSHFGGMTIFGVLTFVLAAFWVFNPMQGTTRQNEKWQQRLITWGKGSMSLGVTSMAIGAFEIERTWSFLFLWLGSFLLVLPFLILSWNK
jgi:hypothetical protein